MEIGSAGQVRKPIVISNQVVSVDLIENVTFEQRHNRGETSSTVIPRVSILSRGISQYQNSRSEFSWLCSERAEKLVPRVELAKAREIANEVWECLVREGRTCKDMQDLVKFCLFPWIK